MDPKPSQTPKANAAAVPLAAAPPYDAVLFDMDGVVTDTAAVHAAACKQLFDAVLREHEQTALPRLTRELCQQPRLAYPRLTTQPDRTCVPPPDVAERTLQRRQLLSAPHHNGRPFSHHASVTRDRPGFHTAAPVSRKRSTWSRT